MARQALLITIGILSALVSACASPPSRHASPVESTLPRAAQAWRYALPANWTFSQAHVHDGAIVLGSDSEIRVLDAASGRLRWRRADSVSADVVGETIEYGTAGGALVSRALRDGRLRWKTDGVCSAPFYGGPARVSMVVRNGDDVVAGCNGGGLARVAAASGRVLARSPDALRVDQFSEIRPLPGCALGVSGWSSGAALMEHAAIVDCNRLRPIVHVGNETWILGTVGTIAVIDDMCCFGRGDVYRPATIVRASLLTGALSPEVDLTPEPDRYPANQRPVGQGSKAWLDGNELYLAVDNAVYRYGDPRLLPASPQRLDADLVEGPIILAHDLLAVRARTAGGSIVDEVVRIRNGALEPLWSRPETGVVSFGYDASSATDVLTVLRTDGGGRGVLLVRLPRGPELSVTDPCRMVAASEDIVVTICTTSTLVGHRYLEYAAAYRWPHGQGPAAR